MQLGKAGGDQPPPFLRLNACSVPFQTAQLSIREWKGSFMGKESIVFSFQGIPWKGKYMWQGGDYRKLSNIWLTPEEKWKESLGPRMLS